MATIVDLLRSFQSKLPNAEQGERLHLLRQASASFAAAIFQATRPGDARDRAIEFVRLSLMFAREAIESEEGPEGVETRTRILAKLEAKKAVTPKELSALRGMLGLLAPMEVEEPGGKS